MSSVVRRFAVFVFAVVTMALALGCSDGAGESEVDAGFYDASPLDVHDPAAPFTMTAAAISGTKVAITFSQPPALAGASYAVSGLTIAGTPTLEGNVVTLVTSKQEAKTYTLTVSGVVRASDGVALAAPTATFMGRTTFNVAGAIADTATRMRVTFDAPPSPTTAKDPARYAVAGLTISAASLDGNDVTLTTSPQSVQPYEVVVTGVTRAADSEPLGVAKATFNGRQRFDVLSAQSISAVGVSVTFSERPNATQATTLANYVIPGLRLSSPTLTGNTVTLTTSGQLANAYTVTVSNVTRATDNEPLLTASATLQGTAVLPPTVTDVTVIATTPNNGANAYNTGTTTVRITGTDLGSVACPGGIALDDLDGAGNAVGTKPTTCTVDTDKQITATFPPGIRTNGTTGWNVRVTNLVATNATSSVRFVPLAGLLVSEIYTGTASATDHEFVEIYNPTATPINTVAIGLKLHIRSSGGVDTNKTLTAVTNGIVPSHGFLLLVSSVSDAGDAWFAKRDATFSAALVANGAVYISLSATDDAKVIDKAGWGTQPAGGYEGSPMANIASSVSAERKPAGGAGHAADSDANANDFLAPSATITPRGTADTPQP